jgi:hypothetical protein
MNVLTNINGDRLYMVTYHCFVKYNYIEYQKIYNVDPVKEFFKIKSSAFEENSKAEGKKFEKDMEMCSEFISNDEVYLPICACLVSTLPNISTMEKCLKYIMKLISLDYDMEIISEVLTHLIYEVPSPIINTKVTFYLPFDRTGYGLHGQLSKDRMLTIYNTNSVLSYFSVENIILIHQLMLLEEKILFVGNEYYLITKVIESFINFLYPLKCIVTYLPILSEEMIKYLQSFLPFVMGIEESMLKLAKDFLDNSEDIYIVYINKNFIDVTSSKLKKKPSKIGKNIAEFPAENYEFISSELKILKEKQLKNEKNKIYEVNNFS